VRIKHILLLSLVAIFLLGCAKVLQEESINPTDNKVTHKLTLPAGQDSYEIGAKIYFSGSSRMSQGLEWSIISPSNKKYEGRTLIRNKGKVKAGPIVKGYGGSSTKKFAVVDYEEGEYTLNLELKGFALDLDEVILRVYE
jgi:hypothetical protein